MEKFIKSQLLKADLIEIYRRLEGNGLKDMASMLLVKQIFLTITNLVDFESTIRPFYKEHRELSTEYKKASKEYEFAKYLRNKFVGHIKSELIEKAIVWKPELRYLLGRTDERDVMFVFNLFILETAINTYVNADYSHKIFESETDLVYPPDLERFLAYLTFVVKSAIEYLTILGEVLSKKVEILDFSEIKMEYWITAGQTDFKFIKK